MGMSSARFVMRLAMVAAAAALALPGSSERPCRGDGAAADDLDSIGPGDLVWLARRGQPGGAVRRGGPARPRRHATARRRSRGALPGLDERLLCGAPHRRSGRRRRGTPIVRRVGRAAPRR